jgi:hypothetical protein
VFLAVSGISQGVEVQKMLTAAHVEEWLQHDLFQIKWWFLLALTILVFWVWWRQLDKARLPEVVLYAVLMTIVMMGVDEYGEELVLWDYPIDILPIFPVITAFNLWIPPLAFSLVYQNFPTWKSFTRLIVLGAAAVAFVVEPAMALGGYYQLLKWQYYCNFPIYIVVALIIRWAVVKILAISEKANKRRIV